MHIPAHWSGLKSAPLGRIAVSRDKQIKRINNYILVDYIVLPWKNFNELQNLMFKDQKFKNQFRDHFNGPKNTFSWQWMMLVINFYLFYLKQFIYMIFFYLPKNNLHKAKKTHERKEDIVSGSNTSLRKRKRSSFSTIRRKKNSA